MGLIGQVSMGGIPLSVSHPEAFSIPSIPTYSISPPNVNVLLIQDEDSDRNGFNLRDGVALVVNKGLEDGQWNSMPDGSRVWRMALKSQGALSLELNFDDLFIPVDGELFIFNRSGTEVYGAYTSSNNKVTGKMSVEMIQGDEVRIEFIEPLGHHNEGELHIQDIAYRYRDVMSLSQSCEVDVACNDTDGWADERNSVIRIRSRVNGQFFWCTGTLMNNTDQDCRPLVLSSMHCTLDHGTQSTTSDFDFYRFYFKFERQLCGIGNGDEPYTLAGCMKRADSNDDGGASGSDFILLELSRTLPSEYDPYYAGWNISSQTSIGGAASIHHPSGDVKKISVYENTPISADWGISNTHWLIRWEATETGHGVTESGSSGAPLFDMNGRVIGTLTGGSAYCNDVLEGGQDQPDFFGKMSWHWSQNPNPLDEKLKFWLDPLNTGNLVLEGNSEPCNVLGLEEKDADLWEVFPNPSQGSFSVSFKNGAEISEIQLFDAMGALIEDNRFSSIEQSHSSFILDLSDLERAMYLLNCIGKDGSHQVIRLILQY